MIRPPQQGVEIFLCVEPVDFRKQITGLAVLVQSRLEMNPFSSQLFVRGISKLFRIASTILTFTGLRTFEIGAFPGRSGGATGSLCGIEEKEILQKFKSVLLWLGRAGARMKIR